MSTEVTLIHRSTKFVGFEGSLKRLQKTNCRLLTDTKILAIKGDPEVTGATVTNIKDNAVTELAVDRILGCIGFTPKLGFLKEHGFEIADGSIRADKFMRTSVENIYAIGDISNHPGRIKLISTGFGNVQIALNHIASLVHETSEDENLASLESKADHTKH